MVLTILSWAYLLFGAGMAADDMAMPPPTFTLVAIMWWVMMIAMMVPSAAPAILLYAHVHRARVGTGSPPSGAFLSGYLFCWLLFSLAAAGAQLWLQQASLASPTTMTVHSRTAAGTLLVAAGLYQLSALKDACLGQCRTPAQFLSRHYRPGTAGAFKMGVIHGAFCVGCCWMLMLLLFVGGVMNIVWIAVLALLVAAEKLLPYGNWIARLIGAVLVAAGAALIAT